MFYDQQEYLLRCEWGAEGVIHIATFCDAIIIVDVFSFTTAVDVAVSRGAQVFPYRWRDARAEDFAHSIGAILATASRNDPDGFSLSPHSMLRLERGMRVVLPSPNGATLALATGDTPTFAGCLRNAAAVARSAALVGTRIAVIPAGERWEDGTLRPSLEDLLGAGAILNALSGSQSMEAEAAVAAFLHFRDRLPETLANCGSGKELIERSFSFTEDIRLAAELNASTSAPRLVNGAFVG